MRTLTAPVDWRDCQFISLANAARIAGRSPGWVRGAVTAGDLIAMRLPTGGPPVVTVESLAALLDASTPVPAERVPAGRRSPLQLVVSNA